MASFCLLGVLRWPPWAVVPLAGADSRYQPVWVEDVAGAIVQALARPEAAAFSGQTLRVCGQNFVGA